MTDHGGIIREALNTWCHAQHGGPVCEVCDEIDNALASLDALEAEAKTRDEMWANTVRAELGRVEVLEAELKEAEKANIEWQKQIDYAQERAEAAEPELARVRKQQKMLFAKIRRIQAERDELREALEMLRAHYLLVITDEQKAQVHVALQGSGLAEVERDRLLAVVEAARTEQHWHEGASGMGEDPVTSEPVWRCDICAALAALDAASREDVD